MTTKGNESLRPRVETTLPNMKSLIPDGISESVSAIGQMSDGKRMISVVEFCHRYAIGKSAAYLEMAAGRLRFCKIGRSRRIRVDDAEAWSVLTRQPLPSHIRPSKAGAA